MSSFICTFTFILSLHGTFDCIVHITSKTFKYIFRWICFSYSSSFIVNRLLLMSDNENKLCLLLLICLLHLHYIYLFGRCLSKATFNCIQGAYFIINSCTARNWINDLAVASAMPYLSRSFLRLLFFFFNI